MTQCRFSEKSFSIEQNQKDVTDIAGLLKNHKKKIDEYFSDGKNRLDQGYLDLLREYTVIVSIICRKSTPGTNDRVFLLLNRLDWWKIHYCDSLLLVSAGYVPYGDLSYITSLDVELESIIDSLISVLG